MKSKPTYEELEQRIQDLEKELDGYKNRNGSALLLQYLEAIINNTNLPIYLKDADYNYILVNREYERLAGVTNDQIRGNDDYDIFPEPVARLFREQDEEVTRRRSLVEFEETIPLADGVHTFLTAKFPLVNNEGRVSAVGGVCTDITTLEKTKEALRKNEQQYRSFINSFHGIAYRGDIRTCTPVYFHGAVEQITGYTEPDFIAGAPAWDKLVHPDDLPMFMEQGRSMLNIPDYTFKREYRIITRNGDTKWIFERGRTLCDNTEAPAWIEGTIFDITERKNIEQALRESEEKYRTLVETASLGIQITDREGRIVFSNPAHGSILGCPVEQLVGRYVWDFIDNEQEKETLREYYRFIIQEQPDPEPYFTVNRTPNGREVHVRVDWNYMRDFSGQVTSLCSIVTDISSWIWAEKTLKESERRFRSLIESCPVGIYMYKLEPDGRLIFTGANPAADDIMGLDHDQLIGMTIEEAFPSLRGTEIPDRFREACRTSRSWQEEQVIYDDQRISGVFAVHSFQTEPGKMAVFFRNITAKRRMEEEVRKVQKLESVGILAGGIAHDFNNLLTAIIGNISMAKLFSQADTGKVLERLTDAEKASLRARDLTQQLLTFSKGGAPVKNSASITDIIQDSTSFMLSGSNVRCDLQFPDDLWPVNIDEGQISQVIQNVIKNADQAMPEGGIVTVRAENVTVLEYDPLPLRPGNYVHLTITDQGVGILEKHLGKIFDPYFSTKQEGSGLGLAACYSIVKNHDGLISADSAFGAGTTFHIYLPSSDREPETRTIPRKKSLRSGEKILIMDDDHDVLNVAVNMLNLMGYTTETATDGSAAISMYRAAMEAGRPFDGVILDLTIPGGMGGRETVLQLLQIDPEVKAIVSSGYANDPIMAEYTKYGFRGVAAKPYDMEHLGQVLRNLFD
ncbi:MAG: PAS domain S-box protein [Desulfobulbaceae bacterium]|nr:PAS domain S-box protein [Desulfobulbaceae bacterium]